MGKSSASGRRMALELLEVQPVNGFHQDVESQSTRLLNGAVPGHAHAPARLTRPDALSSIVYASRAMDKIITRIKRACDSKAPMLITGETGTGKGLIARAVHDFSLRRKREFIPFSCGEAPPELIASELFGHRRGAFTGADRDYKGVIRAADGGALFLDEIGELPLEAQSKLLRFLQEGEVRPLGETMPIKVKVRVVAATNRDLEADVRSGRFRDDLLWRLKVFCIHIPPLRARRDDIRPLVEHFLALRQQETGKQGLQLSDEAWVVMLDYHWPGNAREVEAWSHRLVADAANGEMIVRETALNAIGTRVCNPPPAAAIVENGIVIDLRLTIHEAKNEVERLFIVNALSETGCNLSQSAKRLGMSLLGLKKAIKRLGIEARASVVVSSTKRR